MDLEELLKIFYISRELERQNKGLIFHIRMATKSGYRTASTVYYPANLTHSDYSVEDGFL